MVTQIQLWNVSLPVWQKHRLINKSYLHTYVKHPLSIIDLKDWRLPPLTEQGNSVSWFGAILFFLINPHGRDLYKIFWLDFFIVCGQHPEPILFHCKKQPFVRAHHMTKHHALKFPLLSEAPWKANAVSSCPFPPWLESSSGSPQCRKAISTPTQTEGE